jgi:hypothetical protein
VCNAFYLSISLIAATLIYVVLVLPESRKLTPSCNEEGGTPIPNQDCQHIIPTSLTQQLYRVASAVLTPLTVFKPRLVPGKPHERNYNLTLVATGFFAYVISTVSCVSSISQSSSQPPPLLRQSIQSNIFMHNMSMSGQLLRCDDLLAILHLVSS